MSTRGNQSQKNQQKKRLHTLCAHRKYPDLLYCGAKGSDISCLMAWDCHQQGQGWVSSSQQEVLTLFATNLWPVADADHSIN